MGYRPMGVGQDPSLSTSPLDGIDHRHVIRVRDAFEAIVIADDDIAGGKGLPGVEGEQRASAHLEVIREAPAPQVLDRAGDRPPLHALIIPEGDESGVTRATGAPTRRHSPPPRPGAEPPPHTPLP